MRVALVNVVASNTGDAAILLALQRVLRRALGDDTQFSVFHRHPRTADPRTSDGEVYEEPQASLVGTAGNSAVTTLQQRRVLNAARRPALRRWSLGPRERVVLDALEDCDAVVSTGGTYLVDRYWVAGKLFALELGHALGRPVALATQSIGAFRSSSLRARLREALQPCRGVWLRDDRSLRNLSAMGVDRPRIELRPDLAFSLADRDQLRAAGRRRWPTSPRIAVSVRELHPFVGGSGDQAAYETAVRALVIHLVEHHGADVCFLSTCQGVPGYRFDDARVAARIHRTLPAAVAAHCCVDAGYHEPEALPARLADFDLAVATRMHVAILALAAGTPALPIAYEFKTRELFAQLGASDWVSTAQELDAPGLRDRCDAMLQALPRRRAELFERVAIYAERAGATQPWCAALPPRG